MRIDNLIRLHILQHTILMDARRMGKSITSHDSFIRLYRHIHQAGHHAAGRINLLRIDICFNLNILMAFDNHSHFLKRSVTGTLTDTIDGNLHLTRTIQHTRHSVGRSHSQVIVTVGREDSPFNAAHVFHQILDLRAVFIGQAVTGRIRNIHYRGTRLDNGFHHTSQILIIRTAGILCIEFHIIHIAAGILHGSHCTFYDFLTI